MKYRNIFLLLVLFGTVANTLSAQDNTKGYYKDLFVDGGITLTSRNDLPAAVYLQLSMESFLCEAQKTTFSPADTLMQRQLIGGSPIDENGILLYPDGQPRFRMFYMNGGTAARHGRSLGEEGKNSIRQFVRNGGSYVGSCAGAFIASRAVKGDSALKYLDSYLGIWQGLTISTGIVKSQTRLTLDSISPLLRYYDFGGRLYVDSVRHNGGGFAVTDTDWPEGSEILARYDISGRNFKLKRDIQGKPAIWAQKASRQSGRVIMCGSHPEFVASGERLELMCAMVRYALDGNGEPQLKAELTNGKTRNMFCETSDRKPEFTRIGDKQYHHFAVRVPEGTKTLKLNLRPKNGYNNYDLFLLAAPGHFAYLGDAAYKDLSTGAVKELVITDPKPGVFYVSVYCNTTVETEQTLYGTRYTGRLDVLNGVPYSITAEIQN